MIEYKLVPYLQLLILSALMVSCAGKKDNLSHVDAYINVLSQQIPEAGTAGIRVIETPSDYNPTQALRWSTEHLVVADASRKSLVLFRIDGISLSQSGGEGRGPGEFEVINQLHRGADDHLYVLDSIQRRISKFKVEDGELLYVQSFSPEVPDQGVIKEIFVTRGGSYALYSHMEDYSSGENCYHVYSTDDQFNPVEFLFEIDGIEKIPFRQGAYVDHPLAKRALWAQSGTDFYTMHSHDTSWERRDLQNGETPSYTILNETNRPINEHSVSYLAKRLEPVINAVPAVREAIRDTEQLPLHHSFFVEGEWAVITTFYVGGPDGVVMIHNTDSDQTFYANVPPHFYPFSFNGNELIGISRPSGEQVKIMLIEIEWQS